MAATWTSGGKQERQAYPHTAKGPKTLRNGPREHIGAISLLPIFVHPAGSRERHANKEPFQKLGFSCSR